MKNILLTTIVAAGAITGTLPPAEREPTRVKVPEIARTETFYKGRFKWMRGNRYY